MPAKIFKFGDVLKEIPGITRRDLYYWISEGFIKPIAVKKKKVNTTGKIVDVDHRQCR